MTDIENSLIYAPSEDVVAREIEGEIIIVPLAAGIGDLEDELYSLNDTGRDVWQLLDGKRTVVEIIASLADMYDAPRKIIEQDVRGLLGELNTRKIIVEISS